MDVFEAIHTTRSMRRLDPNSPVADEDIRKILVAATKAANGQNNQPVRWIVVTDSDQRRRLGEVYQRCASDEVSGFRDSPLKRSSWHLVQHMGESPVLLVACTEGDNRRPASVFPAVQNLMVAARALGLGTTLTTMHLQDEETVRQILGIPADVQTYCIIPVGYPMGRWGEAPRRPVEEVAYRDRWGTPITSKP
jgi:nitroreductase